MVFEALVVKGLVAIGHYAAAHMTAGAAAAVVHAAAGMTLAQIASATVTAGFVTGCVVWTGERIKNVQKGVKAIENWISSNISKITNNKSIELWMMC